MAALSSVGACASELLSARVGDIEFGPSGAATWRLRGVRNSSHRPRSVALEPPQASALRALMAAGRSGRAPAHDEPVLAAAGVLSFFSLRDKLRAAGISQEATASEARSDGRNAALAAPPQDVL